MLGTWNGMMDEIKGYSILGFIIGIQNVSIFKY